MKYPCRVVFVLSFFCSVFIANAQVNYTANTVVPPYNGYFQYGANMGYYGPTWNDETLANIMAGNSALNIPGINGKTLRIPLPESFLQYWGYGVRVNEFNHYANLGMKDHTIFLAGTDNAHRDPGFYEGCNAQSWLWANMYTPIWDGGANGTPVNENNYYALYVYKTVSIYKNYVKFWEILNEPDYDVSGNGWKDPGQPGNWWDNNPTACQLYNLRAPIFHYIRMLRISYDVIKSLDPTAYIAIGGVGFPSFLDAVLRNTDNPANGAVSGEFPLKGGAYFDVVSYHNYPMYGLMYWDNSINNFAYKRHSDAAVDVFINAKDRMQAVLNTHGYNNATYPSKLFISTETNIPRKELGDYIGSDAAQTNYVMKALIRSQQHGIRQLYFFTLGESHTLAEATAGYEVMGLYQKLEGAGPVGGGAYNQQYTSSGIGFKTTSDLLHNHEYDSIRTQAMNLPANVGGGAFKNAAGSYVYVLWARTHVDKNENPSATYSFPTAMNVAPQMTKRAWDYSITAVNTSIPSTNIALNGTPVFLSENIQVVPIRDRPTRSDEAEKKFALQVYPNPAHKTAAIKFTLTSPERVTIGIYDEHGRLIKTVPVASQLGTGNYVIPVEGIQKLASGVYYCRFETEKIQIIRKLVVAR